MTEKMFTRPHTGYGFGAEATGGTGGTTYTPTNESELNMALGASVARIVNIENNIDLTSRITVTNDNVTVQSSNGSSITGEQLVMQCSNFILEGLRLRPSTSGNIPANTDSLSILATTENISLGRITHCDLMFSTDELATINGNGNTVGNITFEYCLFAWGLNPHSKGPYAFNGWSGITYHHNIIFAVGERVPRIKADIVDGFVDFRNNLIANRNGVKPTFLDALSGNVINNIYQYGVNDIVSIEFRFEDIADGSILHQSGNKRAISNVVTDATISIVSGDAPTGSEQPTTNTPPTTTADVAYHSCLAKAGVLPRDTYSQLAIDQIIARTGERISDPAELD